MPMTKSKTISFTGAKLTLGDLTQFVEEMARLEAPEDTSISVTVYAGDQRDPGYTTLKATVQY